MATAFVSVTDQAVTEVQETAGPRPVALGAIRTIVVPLDGSQIARAALAPAAAFARRLDAELVLLRMVTPASVPGIERDLAMLLGETDAQVGLRQEVERLRGENLQARELVLSGPAAQTPADAILAAIVTTGAQLIVMATHGRTGLTRAILGSVAEAVVREAPIPVLLVNPQFGTERRPAAPAPWEEDEPAAGPSASGDAPLRLMVALDGTSESEAALIPAVHLAQALGAQVSLVRVVAGNTSLLGSEARSLLASEQAASYLQRVALRLQETGLRPDALHVAVRIGSGTAGVAETLLDQAGREQATILVVATHVRTGLATTGLGALVLRSATREIVARALIPVLVVHAQ